MRIFDFSGFVLFLLGLIIIAAVVYAVVTWRRREGASSEVDTGIGTLRRLYFYIVSFVALMMAAFGVATIAQFALEEAFGQAVLVTSNRRLAIGLALLIVGLPLWAVHWAFVRRYVRELPVERRSIIRKVYIYLVLGVAIGFFVSEAIEIVQFLFRSHAYSGYPWASVVVWGVVWAFHWSVEESEGQPTLETQTIRRLYVYAVSLATLAQASLGVGRAIHVMLIEGYDSVFSMAVLLPTEPGLWRPVMRIALSLVIVGGAVWVAHWAYFARRDGPSLLRQLYLYVFIVLGGAATTLVPLGVIINSVFEWLLGAAGQAAVAHFRLLPASLATMSIGIALGSYHWSVASREASASTAESRALRRTISYITAAGGLVTLGVGIGVAVDLALGVLVESRDALLGTGLWKNQLAAALTLGVLGAPVWGYVWTMLQRQVSLGEAEERLAMARRIFIILALSAGMLATLGSVSSLLFFFLRDLLGDGLSRETLRDARPALAILAAVAVFLPYYWIVYRQDRQAEPLAPMPAERPRRKEVSVLAGDDADPFIRSVEAALGYRVTTLRWADPGAALPQLAEAQYQELAQRINEASGPRVLLIPDGTTVRVLSYS